MAVTTGRVHVRGAQAAATPDARITIADKLFAAWSSGDLDAPAEFLATDAVLTDVVSREHHGRRAIRSYFARGLKKWLDLAILSDQHWVNDTGVALNWAMTGTIHDDSHGAEAKGKKWRSEGTSWLVFDGHIGRTRGRLPRHRTVDHARVAPWDRCPLCSTRGVLHLLGRGETAAKL
jgi:uncharacterized protein (TIGR02246 family)